MRTLILIACVAPLNVFSQIVIPAGTTIAVANNPEIGITTSENVSNSSAFDFSGTQLGIELIGTNQSISGNIITHRLHVDGGGIKTVNGNLSIHQTFSLTNGFLRTTGSSKLLFTGQDNGLVGGSNASFVEGKFFHSGAGLQRFPVGIQGIGFTPITFENGGGNEKSVEAVPGNPGLTPASSEKELAQIINTHYWKISSQDIAGLKSRVKVSLNGIPEQPNDVTLVVVEADEEDTDAYNIGGSLSEGENAITSFKALSKGVIAIGTSTEIDIVIHDLISPFKTDGYNDFLEIDNIAKFPSNKVTLLDRYGAVIKTWTNFTNYNDSFNPNQDPFAFTKLSAGNYICVVEYGSETQALRKKSQMITVLKN